MAGSGPRSGSNTGQRQLSGGVSHPITSSTGSVPGPQSGNGATGARVTLQLLHALARRNGKFGLLTVCAAGGHGFAMVVERD